MGLVGKASLEICVDMSVGVHASLRDSSVPFLWLAPRRGSGVECTDGMAPRNATKCSSTSPYVTIHCVLIRRRSFVHAAMLYADDSGIDQYLHTGWSLFRTCEGTLCNGSVPLRKHRQARNEIVQF